jgi:hypothetical protein
MGGYRFHLDLTGHRYGRLLVQELVEARRDGDRFKRFWRCLCDCGQTTVIEGSQMRGGKTQSCGCYQRQRTSEASRKHPQSTTPLYVVWRWMIARCSDPLNKSYRRYGGRGIKVCDRWLDSYDAFLADMGPRPADHVLDRIDTDGPYAPENCRWATHTVSCRNRGVCIYLDYEGERWHLYDLAERFGIKPNTLRWRVRHGMTVEEAVSQPVGISRRNIVQPVFEGQTYPTLTALAGDLGLEVGTLRARIRERRLNLRELLALDVMPGKRPSPGSSRAITFRGRAFASHKDLCREYSADYGRFMRRLTRGWDLERALGPARAYQARRVSA